MRFLCVLALAIVMSGCDGNSEVESLVYSRHNGLISCPWCKKQNPYYFRNAWLFEHSKSKWIYQDHAIEKVYAEKGVVKDVWVVTIESKCPEKLPRGWGKITLEEEYSYRKNKLTFIRTIGAHPPLE